MPLSLDNAILLIEWSINSRHLLIEREVMIPGLINRVMMPYRRCKECKKVWYSSDTTERVWDCPDCRAAIGPELEIESPDDEDEKEEE